MDFSVGKYKMSRENYRQARKLGISLEQTNYNLTSASKGKCNKTLITNIFTEQA